MRLPVQGFRIDDLYATQDHLIITAIIEHQTRDQYEPPAHCADPYPHVVILPNGDKYLEDGHHRTIHTALSGRRTVVARVLDLRNNQP